MNRSIKFLPLLLAFLAPLGASAQDTLRLSLDEAITTAINNNRQLSITRLTLKTADAQIKEAYSSTLPTITINGRYTRNIQSPVFYFPGADGVTRPIKIGSDNAILGELTVNQLVYNQAAFNAPDLAESYSKISRQQLRTETANIVLNVKRAYYGALLAYEALRLNESMLLNSEEQYKNAQTQFKAGLRPEFDAIRAEVQVANQRPSVVQARDNYLQALDNLKLILGIEGDRDVALLEPLVRPASLSQVEPNIAEAEAILERYNAQIQMLKMSADVNRQLIDVKKSDYLPTVSVFGTYQLQSQADNFSDLNFEPSSYVGLNLSLNLFNGFKTKAQVEQARLAYEQSELQVKQAEEGLKTQLGIVLRRIDYSRQRVATSDKTIEQAERAYKIATTSYKAGTGTQLVINDADLALAQAKLNQLNAVYDYNVALAELEQLLGEHYQLTDDDSNVKYSSR